ncbi:conserved protein [Tepidicaulis marinus]|jgi:probable rRNA maturation factor|uniref:Endoribonuclease YbeY n=1 Tax=Tepidicaulis marinus TaxID=1333998 RepID=A0A081B6Y6_9HYPH|nr:rRNA maturation RNase YbeY [Tepidicaulis marinus]GAK43804.1 conserved protein [Tepidicaulis marinus]
MEEGSGSSRPPGRQSRAPLLETEIGRQGGGWQAETEELLLRAFQTAFADALTFPETDWPQEAMTAELSVLLADDNFVQSLNRKFRGKDKPTNVLSFPAPPSPSPAFAGQEAGLVLGDIVFGFETVMREAAEQNKTFDAHMQHLAVHGLLHLLDYDHQSDEEAGTMENYERQILAKLGVGDPYAGDMPGPVRAGERA